MTCQGWVSYEAALHHTWEALTNSHQRSVSYRFVKGFLRFSYVSFWAQGLEQPMVPISFLDQPVLTSTLAHKRGKLPSMRHRMTRQGWIKLWGSTSAARRLLKHAKQAFIYQTLGCVSIRVSFKHGRLRCVSVCDAVWVWCGSLCIHLVLICVMVLSLDSCPHAPTKQKLVSCCIPLFKIIWFCFDIMLLKQCSWGTPHVES